MPAYYPYRTTIHNEFLGVSKEVCGRTEDEFDWRVKNQLAKWAAQERKKRHANDARQQVEDLRLRAETLTAEAKDQVQSFLNVLRDGLSAAPNVDWTELFDRRPLPPAPVFTFNHPKPDLDHIRSEILGLVPNEDRIRRDFEVPEERTFLELILPFLRRRRQRLEEQAAEEYRRLLRRYRTGEKRVVEAYNERVKVYNQRRRDAKQQYESAVASNEQEKQEFLAGQERHNRAIEDFRAGYERGCPEAVERLVRMVLDRSAYPDGIAGDPEVLFDEPSRTLIANFWLPHMSQLPDAVEFKFVASRKEIRRVEMKAPDFQAFYDDVLHQTTLRTIHEVYCGDYARHVNATVFNGWVRGIDPKTGQEFTSCVISCHAPREQFERFDLSRVSAKDCVRGLRGITAGPLAELAPVRPIMAINRDDDRFIEARTVELDPRQNLALMDWEDFEHLVRELFERVFQKDGCEVRVTQASRDRGVDAIAFDPDPIRGGKFVIQAKRYNMVVPVSAVRDLYGTMIDEGATKGLLVTTSHFGHDSYEFAKNKPISLIDGANLVHMFQEHGRAVHIALAPRGDRPGISRRTGQNSM